MRKIWFGLLMLSIPFSAAAQETTSRNVCKGQGAGYATRDATTLSMMGWGFGLAIAIGALCALIPNDGSTAH